MNLDFFYNNARQLFGLFRKEIPKKFIRTKLLENKQILIILPSKRRPEKIEGFYKSWRKTTNGLSEVLVCLEESDPLLNDYKTHKDISFLITSGKTFASACNCAFAKYPNYKYYFLVSDDHRLKTKNWEKRFIAKIKENGNIGIAYGNDLLQGERLATAAFVSGNIFRALGFICLPGLIHMYTDSFWTELGKQLKKLYYFPNIIIEHMHYSVGKSPVDKQYLSVNNKKVAKHDEEIFNSWKQNLMKQDIKKIKKYKE